MLVKNLKAIFNKIEAFLERIPRILGEKTLFAFIVILVLEILFSGLLLYQSVLPEKGFQSEILGTPLQFDEELLDEVLAKWEEREKIFKETEKKQYPDPFWRIIPSPEEGGP